MTTAVQEVQLCITPTGEIIETVMLHSRFRLNFEPTEVNQDLNLDFFGHNAKVRDVTCTVHRANISSEGNNDFSKKLCEMIKLVSLSGEAGFTTS